MQDDEIQEFMIWQSDIDHKEMIRAFRALKLIERIRFTLAVKEDGYVEEIATAIDAF